MSNPLGYATDYGVLDFHVSGDYQTINGIRRAGPAPNALYGPSSSWINIFNPTASVSGTVSTTATVLLGSGTVGANSDLPGLNSYYYSTSASYVYSQAGLNAYPLQIQVSDTSTDEITSISFYLTITNPSYTKFNPNASASALQINTSTGTYNTATTAADLAAGVTAPTGSTSNVLLGTVDGTATPTTSFTAVGNNATVAITKLTTAQIATLAAASTSSVVVPQLSTYSSVFQVTVTLTNGYTPNQFIPFLLNLPISAFYTVPTYPIY